VKKLLITLLTAVPLLADEGMWMPQQMPQRAAELRAIGVELDPNRLADLTGDPLGAVISLGGCTASFVSPEGLVVTNHHCAFNSIQYNSTAERDLITDGFLAKSRADELPAAPGSKVWVTTKIEDVTSRMTANVKAGITDADRAKLLDRREKDLIAECEKPGGVRCRIASVFEGSQYLRQTQLEIGDLRVVYAPSNSIGDFGGDIDNFEWPRHTGDFAFYRAYVDGKPYRPKHWLKMAKKGVSEGDAVLVAGYPGRTFRYKTADEVRDYEEFVYPTQIRYDMEAIRLLQEAGQNNRDVQISNASRIASLLNALKNYTSVRAGFAKDRIVASRVQREANVRAAIAANPSLAKYKESLEEIERLNAVKMRTRERDLILNWLTTSNQGSPMLAQAMTIVRLAHERPKKDIDRLQKYQEREWLSLQNASSRAQKSMNVPSDRAVVRFLLQEAAKLPATQRIEPLDAAVAAAGGIDAFLDRLYGGTRIADGDERAKMFGESVAQLKSRKDTMLEFAESMVPLFESRDAADLAHTGAMARLRPGYFELLRAVSGGALYPDANSTLRVTYGRVEGYSPRDATVMTPQTSLRGLVAKENGEEPFANPKTLLAAAADASKTAPYLDPELKDVPVNFLSTVDTTGGNSGSPTLNAKGEFVGLLFDGNYESIDADFLFNPALTRSIHVDAQYMLWIMDAVDGADDLLRELGVEPKI
jgi:hypothetical protein